jgi:NAD(P)-dependent dehydrogenase (short-subunit alcohol dehydrogenase family)
LAAVTEVVVITEAASGIGRATVLRFARGGAAVHACDRDPEGLRSVAADAQALAGAVYTHVLDVTDPEAVEALAAAVYETGGAVDLLHNNAGVGVSGPVDALALEDWRRVIDVNLMGVVHGVAAFVPRMLAQGRAGHIVNTASSAALMGLPFTAAYSASKFGVLG